MPLIRVLLLLLVVETLLKAIPMEEALRGGEAESHLSAGERSAETRKNAEAVKQERESDAITVSDYCEFLNAVAANDYHHLYESRLETGVYGQEGENTASCLIVRIGMPGHYTYVVTAGEKGKLEVLIDPLSAMRYCNWLENSASTSNFNCCEAATEHGVYEIQNDQLIAINSEGSYFIADEDGLLNDCYDKQLRSSHKTFHVVHDSVALAEKNRGTAGTSLQKIEEGMIAVAMIAGGGGRCATFEQISRDARQKSPPMINANAATPRLMMNPSEAEEGEKALEKLFGKATSGSIERSTSTSATTIARGTSSVATLSTRARSVGSTKCTNEQPRLLGGGLEPTKKSSEEKREGATSPMMMFHLGEKTEQDSEHTSTANQTAEERRRAESRVAAEAPTQRGDLLGMAEKSDEQSAEVRSVAEKNHHSSAAENENKFSLRSD